MQEKRNGAEVGNAKEACQRVPVLFGILRHIHQPLDASQSHCAYEAGKRQHQVVKPDGKALIFRACRVLQHHYGCRDPSLGKEIMQPHHAKAEVEVFLLRQAEKHERQGRGSRAGGDPGLRQRLRALILITEPTACVQSDTSSENVASRISNRKEL